MTAAAIVALRQRLELTQLELAQAIGVHPQTVSRWEHGKARPYIAARVMLRRLSRCRSVDELGEQLRLYPVTFAELAEV
jgi:DNA-binding transcriptional regulator YiaG